MNDKSKLLDDLRINRDDRAEVTPARRWTVILAMSLVTVVALGWWFLGSPQAARVSVATAIAMPAERNGATRAANPSALDASGYVVARRQATVSAQVTGRVVDILIEEGQRVSAGEIVARLDDSNALAALSLARAQHAQAQAELAAAHTALQDTLPIFERNQRQFEQGVISDQAYDDARAALHAVQASLAVREQALAVAAANVTRAEIAHEDTIVRAPFDGVITVKAAQSGEIVSPVSGGGGFTRTGIGTIVDMDSLEVEVDVSESFINRVSAGQPARIRLNAYPDWEIPAQVIAVVPTADRARATVKVRVGFMERDERVLPQMGARVSFLSASADQSAASQAQGRGGVLVPADAVVADGTEGIVYVIEDNRVESRKVQLGGRTDEGLFVLDGISPGARVARGNLDLLSDGMRVRVSD